jgi:prephenate dehydratase
MSIFAGMEKLAPRARNQDIIRSFIGGTLSVFILLILTKLSHNLWIMAPFGASLETLTTVHSHVMGLGQCRRFLRQHGYKASVAADTAGSARMVAQWNDITQGALAPRLAAEVYDLNVLAEDVEDEAHNTTRFILLSTQAKWSPPTQEGLVTSFVFRVRNVPAALYKALGGFATNSINMTKLESYMVEGQFFATQFYAEVDGHPDHPSLALALEELAFFSKEINILGVFPAHPFRLSQRSRMYE